MDTRVESYVDQLQVLVDEVENLLIETKVDSSRQEPTVVKQSTEQLYVRLDDLEQSVAQRDTLLRADDAPQAGITLIEKLTHSGNSDLADQAKSVAQRIKQCHERSMSVFVCQFHLSNLTTDLVRLLTGAEQTMTYSRGDVEATVPQGGLFNESA